MKNSIQLNIGTKTVDGNVLTIPEISTAFRRQGLILTASRIVTGEWQGVEETTLAVECLPALPICHAECRLAIAVGIGKLAAELRQECIALQWPNGSGELCPNVGPFKPQYFHPALAPVASVPACDADKAQFIDYLRSTLIPDLEASGMEATAEDFKTCVRFMDSTTAPAKLPEITLPRPALESILRELECVEEQADEINSALKALRESSSLVHSRLLARLKSPAPGKPEITSGW
jgi:hypothetical protein